MASRRNVWTRPSPASARTVDISIAAASGTGRGAPAVRLPKCASLCSCAIRVRHDRIVTLEPYSDGVGIMRDGVRAKPETFQLGDGWFACNLLRNIEVP